MVKVFLSFVAIALCLSSACAVARAGPAVEAAAAPGGGAAAASEAGGRPTFVAYYESWSAEAGDAGIDARLAGLPSYIDVLVLAFMKPGGLYDGGLDLSGTGLHFPYDGAVLKRSIDALKARNPGTKVLLSVGGATYDDWSDLNSGAVARFVEDFGLDGVDVDFEPGEPGCGPNGEGMVECASDDLMKRSVLALREAVGRPAMLVFTAFNVGAYGEGRWRDAKPAGGEYAGVSLNLLRGNAAAIDMLAVMAYDAGGEFDAVEAYEAYRNVYGGPIVVGFSPPPEAWGGHAYTLAKVTDVLRRAMDRGASGAMLWSIQKAPPAGKAEDMPDAARMAQAICRELDLPDCDTPP